MVYGLANKTYEERIKALRIYTLERRRLRGDLIEMFKLCDGERKNRFVTIFSVCIKHK